MLAIWHRELEKGSGIPTSIISFFNRPKKKMGILPIPLEKNGKPVIGVGRPLSHNYFIIIFFFFL
jgi:hypothetical protein